MIEQLVLAQHRQFGAISKQVAAGKEPGRGKRRPAFGDLRVWMEQNMSAVTLSGVLGIALKYTHKYWSMLTPYTEHDDIRVDNNRIENATGPFIAARKGWPSSDMTAGAHSSAVISSLVETAKDNGVDTYLWLLRVLTKLPVAKTGHEIDALLPWNVKFAAIAQPVAALHTESMADA